MFGILLLWDFCWLWLFCLNLGLQSGWFAYRRGLRVSLIVNFLLDRCTLNAFIVLSLLDYRLLLFLLNCLLLLRLPSDWNDSHFSKVKCLSSKVALENLWFGSSLSDCLCLSLNSGPLPGPLSSGSIALLSFKLTRTDFFKNLLAFGVGIGSRSFLMSSYREKVVDDLS
jgi:hypothetical protein